uniref:Uncharacterized protein n=1 Tax=Rhizophora mucronata TaxID=61149 RepID=A0A2P2PIV9_RHIMU
MNFLSKFSAPSCIQRCCDISYLAFTLCMCWIAKWM